jgi:hypothetical protein
VDAVHTSPLHCAPGQQSWTPMVQPELTGAHVPHVLKIVHERPLQHSFEGEQPSPLVPHVEGISHWFCVLHERPPQHPPGPLQGPPACWQVWGITQNPPSHVRFAQQSPVPPHCPDSGTHICEPWQKPPMHVRPLQH